MYRLASYVKYLRNLTPTYLYRLFVNYCAGPFAVFGAGTLSRHACKLRIIFGLAQNGVACAALAGTCLSNQDDAQIILVHTAIWKHSQTDFSNKMLRILLGSYLYVQICQT